MVLGVGTDLIEIKRVEKAAQKAAFLKKVFTENELGLYRGRGSGASVLAGCFAAKEAVAKALGTGFSGFGPIDVEVLRDGKGAPKAALANGAKEAAEKLGLTALHVSITNTELYAAAFAVAEGNG
jgi:holo-[acyl-carrier protein] synthase